MSAPRTKAPLVAIAGNPNVGKTSIFNRLTGLDLKVTNYPGVTVERQEGHVHLRNGTELIQARWRDIEFGNQSTESAVNSIILENIVPRSHRCMRGEGST